MRNPCKALLSSFRNKQKDPRVRLSVLAVVFALLILGVAHWLILQPAIANVYIGPDCYEGTDYVTSGQYAKFDGGADFAATLQMSGILELGETTEFFYFDNRAADSFIYGKQRDIFALSVRMQDKDLYREKKAAFIAGAIGPMRTDSFAYYYISAIELPGAVLAFQDSTCTIRIVYVTDQPPQDDLLPIIERNSPLFAYDKKKP